MDGFREPCATCGASLPRNMGAVQSAVGRWADATFPQSDGASILRHLDEEIRALREAHMEAAAEFDTRRSTRDAIAAEAADCLLLLLHFAHKSGFALLDAAIDKHAINTSRTWETDDGGKGYWKHVG